MKFFRSNIQHLKSSLTNPDLLAGGAFANACELARKAYYNEGLSEEEAIELGEEFILTSPDTGHSIKTNERVALTFKKYIKSFPFTKEFKPCVLADGSHAIEYFFSLDTGIKHPDLPDRNIKYTGLLDGFYEKSVNGEVIGRYVLDEKTTSRVSRVKGTKEVDLEREADIFRASSQLIGYSVAAQRLNNIKITSGLIRRVPIMVKHEPAYELDIPITQFMRDQWEVATYERIRELVERYIYYRDNVKDNSSMFPHSVFYPSYGSSCNAYMKMCGYAAGCLHKQGEKELAMIFDQTVGTMSEDGQRGLTSLAEYKKGLGL